MYVNRQSKIDNYESQFHGIDPLPRAKEIQEQAGFLSDKEFHYKYADLFLSLRDFQYNASKLAPITKCPLPIAALPPSLPFHSLL